MNATSPTLVVTGRSDTSLQKSSQMATLKPQGTDSAPCPKLSLRDTKTILNYLWETYPPYVETTPNPQPERKQNETI